MENVTLEKQDELNGIISIRVPYEDYKSRFESELQKFKKKAQLKGFRKGHTPMSLVKRMYGQAILADVVQERINTQLQEYLMETKPNFFGQPILQDTQEPLDFSLDNTSDYLVNFEMGLVPEFELQGMDSSTTLPVPKMAITEAEVTEQIESLRRRHGAREEMTDQPVGEMDHVELHLEEYENGQKKEGGVHTHTHFLVNERMSDDLKAKLIGKNLKDTFTFDPYTAEKDATEEYIRKYVLHLDEEGPATSHEFFARIDKIIRVTPAELDEEFYTKAFGPGQIQDETSMRTFLQEKIQEQYDQQIKEYMQDQMRVDMLKANRIPLPESFLRKWVASNEREKDAEEKKEWTELQYFLFFEDLRWSLIRDKIIREHELQVTEAELVADYREKLLEYFGQMQDQSLLDQMSQRVLHDEETRQKLADQIVQKKVVEVYAGQVTRQEETITPEGFRPWMEKAYSSINAYFNPEG
ncbi:MAG: trigger factor [Saprospiraceae bacterium]